VTCKASVSFVAFVRYIVPLSTSYKWNNAWARKQKLFNFKCHVYCVSWWKKMHLFKVNLMSAYEITGFFRTTFEYCVLSNTPPPTWILRTYRGSGGHPPKCKRWREWCNDPIQFLYNSYKLQCNLTWIDRSTDFYIWYRCYTRCLYKISMLTVPWSRNAASQVVFF